MPVPSHYSSRSNIFILLVECALDCSRKIDPALKSAQDLSGMTINESTHDDDVHQELLASSMTLEADEENVRYSA